MRNFQRIFNGLQVVPLLHSVMASKRWNEFPIRTTYPGSPHADADDILLRFNEIPDGDPAKVVDDVLCRNFLLGDFPLARPVIFDLMRVVEGEQLGRVIITRLAPGGWITPHRDEGAPATYYDRYQIGLQVLPGVLFRAGDETCEMQSGEVWWFDNTQEHEVRNNSAQDRIVMIVDIRRTR